jgi:hypothetical protein
VRRCASVASIPSRPARRLRRAGRRGPRRRLGRRLDADSDCLKGWPEEMQSQAPKSAALPLRRATDPPPRRRSSPRPTRWPCGTGRARSRRCGAAAGSAWPGGTRHRTGAHDLDDPGRRPAPATPVGGGWAGIQHRLQNAELSRARLAAGAAGALGSRGPPTVRSQQPPPAILDIRVALNRRATSRSLAPASIRSAAASRTCTRRARPSAVNPPPSGYLILPAQRGPRQPS